LIGDPILPQAGERDIHGNASFTASYFLRALDVAAAQDAGLALLHSHPGGRAWQDMSSDDVAAERRYAAQTHALLGLPLAGLTLATADQAWSARVWPRAGRGQYPRTDCETVRIVGERMGVTYHPRLRPAPPPSGRLMRTVASWGDEVQADLARLRMGVIGAGSVGALVAETLARIGIEHLLLVDFDSVKNHNLDRMLHATSTDVTLARSKVEMLLPALRRSSTAHKPQIETLEASVVEEAGWRAALDCDVLFSCVDRPWPRAVLNLAAYAHLIPVIDGGILVTAHGDGRMLSADWKAHVAAPGRRCLECLGQYDPGLVSVERDGLLDDPSYIAGLPADHPLRVNASVFPFSMSTAAFEVLQLASMVAAPNGIYDLGAQTYHAVPGLLHHDERPCDAGCPYSDQLLADGDAAPPLTGQHPAAERERDERRRRQRQLHRRARRLLSAVGQRLA
jgi:molybdopterin-synthase adenylyltransferase